MAGDSPCNTMTGIAAASFFSNTCRFGGCGLHFPTLADLIEHIEDNHIGKKGVGRRGRPQTTLERRVGGSGRQRGQREGRRRGACPGAGEAAAQGEWGWRGRGRAGWLAGWQARGWVGVLGG